MTSGRALARAGLIVTAAFLVSRVLGWVRMAVIGTTFGATGELDAFFAAFRIPDLIFQLVAAGALSSALIPIVAGLVASGEEARAWRAVATVTNLMLGLLLVLAVIVALAAPAIIPVIAPGFDLVASARTVELTRIMLLSPVLLALGSVATSVLNAGGRFGASALAPITYNLVIIGAAVFLAPVLGVEGLAIGVVAGSLAHLAVQLRPLFRTGFTYEPIADLSDPHARRALVLMAPRAVGLGVSQLTFLVMTSLASVLAVGSITAFNLAFTLLQIPIGVIGVPLGVVVFPSLAREIATGSPAGYVRLLTRALRLLAFVMLPITALAIVLRRQVVTLLFGYGRFDDAAIALTANTLLFFLVGLTAHALIAVLARAFYARQDTRTPVAAAIVAVAVNVGFGVATVGWLGLAGLALAIAIGAWLEAGVLVTVLRRRVPGLELAGLARVLLEAGVASVAAGVAALGTVYLIDSLIGPDPSKLALLAQLMVATAAGGAAFTAIAAALRVPELPATAAVVVDLVRRRGR